MFYFFLQRNGLTNESFKILLVLKNV